MLLSFITFMNLKLENHPSWDILPKRPIAVVYAEINLHYARKTRCKLIEKGNVFKVARHGDPCWSVGWFSWLFLDQWAGSAPFPCWISVLPPLLLEHRARTRMCLGIGGGYWRASVVPFFPRGQGQTCNSLSLLWPSALPDQDFQLALRFCAIFGLTSECYQMSLPLESCARSELPHLSLLPSTAMECAPEAALHPSPSPGHGDTLLRSCPWLGCLLQVDDSCWPSCTCPGSVWLSLCFSQGGVCPGQVSMSKRSVVHPNIWISLTAVGVLCH